nr:WbqC family protein [Sporofaciens musculi]
MKIGIMQPYFFPYIGYFSLIEYVDKFIFFDTPQYISHGWVNRNRVLNQNGNPDYIIVPIKKHHRKLQLRI